MASTAQGIVTPRYELFDHTADLGLRVRAPSLPQLVPVSTDGLYAAIGRLVTLDDASGWSCELAGDEPALLLRDYLAEVLTLFDCQGRQLRDVQVHEFTEQRLAVSGQAVRIDPEGSVFQREVKAITYHELSIRRVAGGYEATFILDI